MNDMVTSYDSAGGATTTTRGGLSPDAARSLAFYRRMAERQASSEQGWGDGGDGATRAPRPVQQERRPEDQADLAFKRRMQQIQLEEAQGAPIFVDQSGSNAYTGMEVRPGQPMSAATGRYRRDQRIPGGNVY